MLNVIFPFQAIYCEALETIVYFEWFCFTHVGTACARQLLAASKI